MSNEPGRVRVGRYTADFPEGTVVFLIGMRINALLQVRQWWPVFMAMPRMLRELGRHRDLGLLGARTYFSGRVVLMVQYWESMDKLMAYASSREAEHLPAWKGFNQRARNAEGAVGIFHEAYEVAPAAAHTVYSAMPVFGMGLATASPPAYAYHAARQDQEAPHGSQGSAGRHTAPDLTTAETPS
jgi:hypothetical protein